MTNEQREQLGPLAALAGVWEGDKGDDVAPSDDRGTENNKYRERLSLTPIGRVDNHEQVQYGLRYATMAWRVGEPNPYHEEVGYWLWDADRELITRCFVVPRGVTVLAGGSAKADATSFRLAAKLDEPTFGICSNPFLHDEFRTVRYELEVEVLGADSFRYRENSVLQLKGRDSTFDHVDQNVLHRVE